MNASLFVRLYFLIFYSEIVLGGGGRILEISPLLTVRMVLASFLMLFTLSRVINLSAFKETHPEVPSMKYLSIFMVFIALYVVTLIFSFLISDPNVPMESYGLDVVRSSIYLLLVPCVWASISCHSDVVKIAKTTILCGSVVSISSIALSCLFFLNQVFLGNLYPVLAEKGEFFFRDGSFFFYKGSVFSSVAFLFLASIQPPFWRTLSVLNIIGASIGLSRGLIASTCICAVFLVLISPKKQRRDQIRIVGILMAFLALFLVAFYDSLGLQPDILFQLQEARSASDALRNSDILAFLKDVNPLNFFIGRGLSSLIGERSMIENTYIDVAAKFGLGGLLLVSAPAVILVQEFLRSRRLLAGNNSSLALLNSYFVASSLFYIVSVFNPFLITAQGIIFVSVSIACCRQLSSSR